MAMNLTSESARDLYDQKQYIKIRASQLHFSGKYKSDFTDDEAQMYSYQLVRLVSNVNSTKGGGYQYSGYWNRFQLEFVDSKLNQASTQLIPSLNQDACAEVEYLLSLGPNTCQFYLGQLSSGRRMLVSLVVFLNMEYIRSLCQVEQHLPDKLLRLVQRVGLSSFRRCKLPDTSGETEYDGPMGSFQLKLFDYQSRSLRWMIRMETSGEAQKFLVPKTYYHKLADKMYVELIGTDGGASDSLKISGDTGAKAKTKTKDSVTSNFIYGGDYGTHVMIRCPGGVLADDMGGGKTVTMIALIYLSRLGMGAHLPPLLTTAIEREAYLSSRATLIVCPQNIVAQWGSEFKKCLGPSMGGLTILTITNKTMMSKTPLASLLGADVIITSYDWLSHQSHLVEVDS
jgi:hypothetical protein